MKRTTAIIIGAGQAGLAMSYHLTALGIDHVLLERGHVANSWRTERWDSLQLLTPNWQSRLPGFAYQGPDPDGFRNMPETISFLDMYASAISAPIETNTTVQVVEPTETGYIVRTDQGDWDCRAVVLASGACNIANKPSFATDLGHGVNSITPMTYRNPNQLDHGGVLVVGASATGVQLAREIQKSGRQVILSTGEHVRVPRTYRGHDIQFWMDRMGLFDEGLTEIDDLTRARNLPSLQLIGSAARETISLNTLREDGVEITGRLTGASNNQISFSGSLANVCKLADLKMNRLLRSIDEWIVGQELSNSLAPSKHHEPTFVSSNPTLSLDLADRDIRTVIWATGYRPDYSWLQVPVINHSGYLRHTGGVVDAPGLYAMGLPFMRRRKSSLIDGAGDDAKDLSAHMAGYLAGTCNLASKTNSGVQQHAFA